MRDWLVTNKAAVATARTAGATALTPAQREELAAADQRIADDVLAANPVPPQGRPCRNAHGRFPKAAPKGRPPQSGRAV